MFARVFAASAANPLLLALWLPWATLLFGGFISGHYDAAAGRWQPTWARIGSSFALVVTAWCFALLGRSVELAPFALLIAIGMTLGFIGDLFMAGQLPGSQPAVGGMGSFGLGHVAYIAAALTAGRLLGLEEPVLWAALGGWLLIGFTGWYFVVFSGREAGVLHRLALPYSLLLAGTAGVATGLALQDAHFWPFAAGAALFFVSDMILAAGLFGDHRHRKLPDLAIWLTYGTGQMLIIYGVTAVLLGAD
jgi:hypothetical protein